MFRKVNSATILVFAFIAAISADVSELSAPPRDLLAPSSELPSAPALIAAAKDFDRNVPYGVNPFGKNANHRPLPRPASLAVAPVVAAPRIVAKPRALVAQPSVLPKPQPFQSAKQRAAQVAAQPIRAQPILAAQPSLPRALPIVDRSLLNEINAKILHQDQVINPDGSYQFSFETDNGIVRSEKSTPTEVTGSYSYIENGVPIQVTYIADENGFRAIVSENEIPISIKSTKTVIDFIFSLHFQGDHLPTPPPTPPHILRALEFLAKLPKKSIRN